MNYEKLYLKFIFNIKRQDRKISDRFYEKHHIFPKSIFPNLRNKKNNIILVTPREHFVLHKILVKVFERRPDEYRKMCLALFFYVKDRLS